MSGTAGPWTWHAHPGAWCAVAAVVGGVVLLHRRLLRTAAHPVHWSRRQIVQFAGAMVVAAVATTWPLADLAAHWTLTGLVVQRLLCVLVVAPLLLLGLPDDVVERLTRPAPVDRILRHLHRPPVAILTVTGLLVASMSLPVVRAQAASPVALGAVDLVVVGVGLVLWIPVVGRVPGLPRYRPVLRFGYLVGQAVVPAFLSFVYIFSVHPLYSTFARSTAAVHLRPLVDQQVAGFVSKLSMLLALLSVAGVVLARASVDDDEAGPREPLRWADVQREFERADRRRRTGRGGDVDAGGTPDPAADGDPGVGPAHGAVRDDRRGGGGAGPAGGPA